MKRIKVVISDLHLGRGRTLEGGATNSLEEFYFGKKLIEFFNYYCSGEFREAEVEVVINGDFLNFLQTDYNGHFLTVITEGVALVQLQSILDGHKDVFESMKAFAAHPNRIITYVVGNHDQAMLWPATRRLLNDAIACDIRYKNIVYFFDGVHIEHGHMHEAANRFDPKRFFLKRDLPEPILNLPFGSHFFVDFVLKIKQKHSHIDKVRPFKALIRWSIINETKFTLATLVQLVMYFFKMMFTADPRRHFPFSRILRVLAESAIFPDLSESARRVLGDERVHTVIFGHSHVYQYRQWGLDKEYFNTGTWTDLTSLDIQSLGKITKLTYVLIEYPDDGGRPRGRLKEWRGYHRIEEDVAVS